jgi:hypothetical protein
MFLALRAMFSTVARARANGNILLAEPIARHAEVSVRGSNEAECDRQPLDKSGLPRTLEEADAPPTCETLKKLR